MAAVHVFFLQSDLALYEVNDPFVQQLIATIETAVAEVKVMMKLMFTVTSALTLCVFLL